MCGEYREWDLNSRIAKGSPPHVRGILIFLSVNHSTFRITPACAGNTMTVFKEYTTSKDHPRMCGEY